MVMLRLLILVQEISPMSEARCGGLYLIYTQFIETRLGRTSPSAPPLSYPP
jgi:hypothetical protein